MACSLRECSIFFETTRGFVSSAQSFTSRLTSHVICLESSWKSQVIWKDLVDTLSGAAFLFFFTMTMFQILTKVIALIQLELNLMKLWRHTAHKPTQPPPRH